MTEIIYDEQTLLVPIQAKLRRLIWRTRAVLVLRGVACTLAAGLLAILAAMGVASHWLLTEAWQHYGLTAGWVVAAAVAAWLTLLRPMAQMFTLRGVARTLERRHPEMKERISSTVQLLASGDAPEVKGSALLIHALAKAVSAVRPLFKLLPSAPLT